MGGICCLLDARKPVRIPLTRSPLRGRFLYALRATFKTALFPSKQVQEPFIFYFKKADFFQGRFFFPYQSITSFTSTHYLTPYPYPYPVPIPNPRSLYPLPNPPTPLSNPDNYPRSHPLPNPVPGTRTPYLIPYSFPIPPGTRYHTRTRSRTRYGIPTPYISSPNIV